MSLNCGNPQSYLLFIKAVIYIFTEVRGQVNKTRPFILSLVVNPKNSVMYIKPIYESHVGRKPGTRVRMCVFLYANNNCADQPAQLLATF